jgi:hypothetical protein
MKIREKTRRIGREGRPLIAMAAGPGFCEGRGWRLGSRAVEMKLNTDVDAPPDVRYRGTRPTDRAHECLLWGKTGIDCSGDRNATRQAHGRRSSACCQGSLACHFFNDVHNASP